jgi:N-sulfoglucosamine sulfohydrolase
MMKHRNHWAVCATLLFLALAARGAPLNIVLITADDMNWDSVGCNGCKVPDITPNIDRLASQGMLFREAHATVPVCQPVRATMSTGLYPIHSGCKGFEPIRAEVTTINEVLHRAGYLISMMGKNPHYQPHAKWCVDYEVLAKELMVGRSPERFGEHTRKFLEMAAREGKPFFHHVNCQDPHRPFLWNSQKAGKEGTFPGVSRVIRPDEVEVPGFLESLPAVRQEVADYFTCVHRLDETVGAVMRELKAAGHEDDTLVMFFGGDHGMPFPFGKANVYDASSQGTLILRWPGTVPAGKIDAEHLVATIDFAPTLLEAAGLPALEHIDGRSFLPVAKGGRQDGRDTVFTMFHETSGKRSLEMRCVSTRASAYIWNAWSDGTFEYRAENMSGQTWKAMLAAAKDDPAIRERCEFYLHRAPEEFYQLGSDPTERGNRITDPACAAEVKAMRQRLAGWMERNHDPLAGKFAQLQDGSGGSGAQ